MFFKYVIVYSTIIYNSNVSNLLDLILYVMGTQTAARQLADGKWKNTLTLLYKCGNVFLLDFDTLISFNISESMLIVVILSTMLPLAIYVY